MTAGRSLWVRIACYQGSAEEWRLPLLWTLAVDGRCQVPTHVEGLTIEPVYQDHEPLLRTRALNTSHVRRT